MLRLAGLPNTGRYPEATVIPGEDRITIHFGGRGYEQTMSVPVKYLGAEDEESAGLWLMAQLQETGYTVRRGE